MDLELTDEMKLGVRAAKEKVDQSDNHDFVMSPWFQDFAALVWKKPYRKAFEAYVIQICKERDNADRPRT